MWFKKCFCRSKLIVLYAKDCQQTRDAYIKRYLHIARKTIKNINATLIKLNNKPANEETSVDVTQGFSGHKNIYFQQ